MGIGEGVPRADTEEEQRQKREDEEQGLRDQLTKLTNQMEALELDMKKFTAGIQQVREGGYQACGLSTVKMPTTKVLNRSGQCFPRFDQLGPKITTARQPDVPQNSFIRLLSDGGTEDQSRAE